MLRLAGDVGTDLALELGQRVGARVSTWTASEWATKTGTRTAVHDTRRSARWRILRLSSTTFHSSFV